MKSFNLLSWFLRPRTNLYPKVSLDFRCTACEHQFKGKVRRLYIDLNTYDARYLDEGGPTRSEFIVAERVSCPNCQVVDQYRLGPAAFQRLAETQLIANNGLPHPNQPIQCIRFSLRDGRAMHPLDALAYLAEQVADQSDPNEIRLEYANLLRMLGYQAEAEAQYRLALARDPTEPEALLNLAIFHGKRYEKEAAAQYLITLADSAERGRHPDQALFAQAAQDVMDGVVQMDSIELTAPALFNIETG